MSDLELGKFISYILRHNPGAINISMDEHGWVDVNDLIEGINKDKEYKKYDLTFEKLKDIVKKSIKNDDVRFSRYSFNDNYTKIRANQGHSIKGIDVELEERIPPDFLYHGTVTGFIESINKNGIEKGERLHVHLSDNINTAITVGNRHKKHGETIVITINTKKMYEDGYKFFLSKNNVWLTDHIPTKYFK